HEAAARLERHKFNMPEARDLLFCEDDAGAMGQTRNQLTRFAQKLVDRLVAPIGDLRFYLAPLVERYVADLEKSVDEQPKAKLGRQAPGGRVRRNDEAELLQIRHDVADRRR